LNVKSIQINKYNCSRIDYTYHFNMLCFHVLDHFLVPRGLYGGAVNS
jgi:hypothetical protein